MGGLVGGGSGHAGVGRGDTATADHFVGEGKGSVVGPVARVFRGGPSEGRLSCGRYGRIVPGDEYVGVAVPNPGAVGSQRSSDVVDVGRRSLLHVDVERPELVLHNREDPPGQDLGVGGVGHAVSVQVDVLVLDRPSQGDDVMAVSRTPRDP